MPSEVDVKIEAKAWLHENKDADIGSLTRAQSEKLLTALYAAGASHVWALNPTGGPTYPFTDTIYITTSYMTAARVMTRLANFHPDETELLKDGKGCHTIRAWWD